MIRVPPKAHGMTTLSMSYKWALLINHFIQWLCTWPRFETEAWVARKWPVADLRSVCCHQEKLMFVIVIQTATTDCSENVYCTAHCIIDCRLWTCVTFNRRTRQISYVFAAKPHRSLQIPLVSKSFWKTLFTVMTSAVVLDSHFFLTQIGHYTVVLFLMFLHQIHPKDCLYFAHFHWPLDLYAAGKAVMIPDRDELAWNCNPCSRRLSTSYKGKQH